MFERKHTFRKANISDMFTFIYLLSYKSFLLDTILLYLKLFIKKLLNLTSTFKNLDS